MTIQEKLKEITERLERLQRLHEKNRSEIVSLQFQIETLRKELPKEKSESKPLVVKESQKYLKENFDEFIDEKTPLKSPHKKTQTSTSQSDIEQYIGGNLINKIGIVILIFGLGLFVKYAIDNGFFPPLVRLILSFAAGLTLVTVGIFLKSKYKTYSAVLFSGGMVVLYFTAYGGSVFFDPSLLPRNISFYLMVIFTVVTVIAAMIYDLQIIGLLGLVGAYAVPFLLSDSSGSYRLLLSYLAVINIGILVISIKKLWKGVIYTAFFLSWLIFSFWWINEYSYAADAVDGWLFLMLFFALFYSVFIGHQYFSKKEIPVGNIVLLIFNAFIFYGFGMDFLSSGKIESFQGLFTIGNGFIHLGLSFWVYRKWTDQKLFYTLLGLFLTFVTIAIPVQFKGDVIPILWMAESIILFYLARRFNVIQLEFLTYIVLFLAQAIMIINWIDHYYDSLIHYDFLLNKHFLTSTLMILGLLGLNIINERIKVDQGKYRFPLDFGNMFLPVLLVGVLYFSFFNEIYHHFEQAFINSGQRATSLKHISHLGNLWLINYTFVFLSILGFINFKRWQNGLVDFVVIVFGGLVIVYFLTGGILAMNTLRSEYLSITEESHFGFIWIRYACYLFMGILILAIYFTIKQSKELGLLKKHFPLFVSFIVLVFLSNELTTIMQFGMGIEMESLAHKVGYSILWGVYSLALISIGFWKKSSQLRIAAMVLFAVTLLKVFLIDLEHISTISRMVVFIALGVLLLVISYLYQRYRNVLLGEDEM